MNTDSDLFSNPPRKPVRLACIGAGWIFRNAHAKALKELQARGWPVEVAMVCDRNPAALEEALQLFPSAKAMLNLDDLLVCSKDVDVLMICLWPPLSLDVLRKAIVRGFKKILVEKPVSHHAADVRVAAEEARRAGVQVQVAYNRQHQPALAQFTEAVRSLKPLESFSATLLRVARTEPIFYEDVTPHLLSVLYPLLGNLTVQHAVVGADKNGIPEFIDATLQNAVGVQVKMKLQPYSGQELELYEARSADQDLQLRFLPSNTPEGAGWGSSRAGISDFHRIPEPEGLDESLTTTWRTGFLSQMAGFLREEPASNACSLDEAACILEILEALLSRRQTPSSSAVPVG